MAPIRASAQKTGSFSAGWLASGVSRVHLDVSSPALALLVSGFFSAWLYWEAFVRRVPLLRLYSIPRLDGSFLHQYGKPLLWHFILSFLALAILYRLAWLAAQNSSRRTAWLIVIGGSLVMGAILLYMAPFDSSDIYDNIVHGRILGVYNDNPFKQVGAHYFPRDQFIPFMGWKRSPSAYGPLWEMIAGITAMLAGDGILANVIAFKLLAGIFTLGSVVVVALILRRVAPQHALAGTLLLGWNPAVLYETWGNGHNDMAMVFWVLLGVLALVYARYTLAILSLVCGTLIKYLPVLLIPAAGIIALVHLKDWRARLRFIVLSGLGSLALIYMTYSPFWEGPQILTIQRRERLFTATLPSTFYNMLKFFKPELSTYEITKTISTVAFILTILFALFQALRAWRGRPWEGFSQSAFDIQLFYLLFTNLWFQQWYTLWLIGLAPLLHGRSRRLAILFGFSALAKQFIVGPAIFWKRPIPEQPWLELWFTLGSLGIPLAYALFACLAGWLKPGWSLNLDMRGGLADLELALDRASERSADWVRNGLTNFEEWLQQRRGRLSG